MISVRFGHDAEVVKCLPAWTQGQQQRRQQGARNRGGKRAGPLQTDPLPVATRCAPRLASQILMAFSTARRALRRGLASATRTQLLAHTAGAGRADAGELRKAPDWLGHGFAFNVLKVVPLHVLAGVFRQQV